MRSFTLSLIFAHLLTLFRVAAADFSYRYIELSNGTSPVERSTLAQRQLADPTYFGWVRRWAAVGDSFTAGIGSGSVYSKRREDVACSRYDYSYPAIVNKHLGSSVS